MSSTQSLTQEQLAERVPTASIKSQASQGIPLRDLTPPKERQEPERALVDQHESGAPPDGAFSIQQRWNNPKSNVGKLAAVFLSLMAVGMSDASYGALLPSLGTYYKLDYTIVSLVFLLPFAGYSVAAIFSNMIHEKLGQRGVALFGTVPRLVAYIVICLHPPYPVVISILALAGFGNGVVDAGWNAYVGSLANTNELLGILHGFFGIGATISPLIVAAMVNTYHLQWYEFFYVQIGVVALELATSLYAFGNQNGDAYRKSKGSAESETGMTKLALKQRTTWVCSAFLLAYVGTEVSLGGWIVESMLRIRHGQPFASGLTATGFWLGITVGRFTLGFITPRIGEKLAVSIYLVLAMALELIFWLVPQFIVSAVAVALVGFFLGPLFPAAIIAVTKILPPKLHVPAIGISASIGGGGAALLPFAVGAVAQAAGVQTLQPIVLGLIGVLFCIWMTLPRIPKHAHTE